MVSFRKLAAVSLALALTACVSTSRSMPPPGQSYYWLPWLHISAPGSGDRIREQVDIVLTQRGYSENAAAPLALIVSTDSERDGDGSLGFGDYAGGYTYFAAEPAPAGFFTIDAYDMQTRQLVWRATLPRGFADESDETLQLVLAQALASLPQVPVRSVADPT